MPGLQNEMSTGGPSGPVRGVVPTAAIDGVAADPAAARQCQPARAPVTAAATVGGPSGRIVANSLDTDSRIWIG